MNLVIVKFEKRRNNSYVERVIKLVQLLYLNVNIVEGKISFLIQSLLSLAVTWNWSLKMYGLWNHLESMRNELYLGSM